MHRSNIATLEQFTSRSWRSKMSLPPLFTTCCISACLGVYLLGAFGVGLRPPDVCLLPSAVLSRFQIYRILLAPWYHGGFIHILFNMLALYFMGSDFERQVGSLAAAYTTLVVLIPLIGVLHTATAYFFDALAGSSLRNNCAVGISGVIFSLIVVQLKYAETVSFFGFFSLPANVYPFFLLVVLSLLSPGLSFIGHLSGIIVGYGLIYAFFTRIIPSDAAFDAFDTRLGLKSLPLHCANPDAAVSAWAQNSGLPTTNSAGQTSSISGLAEVMKAWFAGLSSGGRQASSAFTGEGHTLGSSSSGGAAQGRIPASSRLLAGASSSSASDVERAPAPTEQPDSAPAPAKESRDESV
jgi:membrane associated rhomboid family serine protease